MRRLTQWRTAPRRAMRVAQCYRARCHNAERIARELMTMLAAVSDGATVLRERCDDLRARLDAAERHIGDAEATIQKVLQQRDALSRALHDARMGA